jgi:hypothetical protein
VIFPDQIISDPLNEFIIIKEMADLIIFKKSAIVNPEMLGIKARNFLLIKNHFFFFFFFFPLIAIQ